MIKVIIELDDGLLCCELKRGRKTIKVFNDCTRLEQIRICNALASYYKLFSKCIKEE